MYERVITGSEGRGSGWDAACLARSLASPDAEFVLVYVGSMAPTAHPADVEVEYASERDLAELFAEELTICGPRAEVVRHYASSVGAGLQDAAELHRADLLVVGRSRRHGLGRLLSGDDTQSALHHCPCALAIAPLGHHEQPGPISRIGVAFDGEPSSEVALATANLLAKRLRARLTPLAVIAPHYYAPGTVSPAPAPIEDPDTELAIARPALEKFAGPGLEMIYGDVGAELVRFSEQVDLLVCGSQHHGALGRLLIGSTSGYLARHAHGPLLITPVRDDRLVSGWRARRAATTV